MQHIFEQDTTINSDAKCSLIKQALAGYEEQYHTHIYSLQQRQITDFLHRPTKTQPQPQPGPSNRDHELEQLFDGSNDDEEFGGFSCAEAYKFQEDLQC